MKKKSYTELIQYSTYEDRLKYLMTNSSIGIDTFGHNRYLNQGFYNSKEWRDFRNYIILRDKACDLAISDRPIFARPVIHHIVPLTVEDLIEGTDALLDPNNVITVSSDTHKIIHYGDISKVEKPIERSMYDTCPWKKLG